jgi:pyrroline-5-carboxylate reductase
MVRLAIVGGGRMGEALLGGLVSSGWAPADELAVIERVDARRVELSTAHSGVVVVASLAELPEPPAGAVVAVKPADVPTVVGELSAAGVARLLSIAAGITLASLEAALAGPAAVVRAMPNTPALVGAGAAAVAGGSKATDEDLAWAEGILASVGVAVRVSEPLLDAVTGLSGSGPAYVFLVAEAMVEAGVLAGLPRDISQQLAIQTLLGSARMLAETGDGAADLRAAVTSPGGTTAAGLHALEQAGVRAAFLDAVAAAANRSRELGGR